MRLAVVLIGLTLLLAFCSLGNNPNVPNPSNTRQRDKPLSEQKVAVSVTCEELVSSALKVPSTAKFNFSESKWWTEGNTGYYEAYVDAENSFGAMLRSTFLCSYDHATKIVKVLRID
jgi:hypothetical protein